MGNHLERKSIREIKEKMESNDSGDDSGDDSNVKGGVKLLKERLVY